MTLPRLVLVPGLGCTADLWRDQSEMLGQMADIHITDEHRRHDTISAMAAAILSEQPTRFALAGLSMGGYIALEIVRQAPERVTGLALLDTSARPEAPAQTERRLSLLALAETAGMGAAIAELLPAMIHPDRLGDRDLTGRIITMADDTGRNDFTRQQKAIIARPDARPSLGRITCPTVVACGDVDQITLPEWSREMAALIPHAHLELIPACGHMSSMEQPTAVHTLLCRVIDSYNGTGTG